MNSPEPPTFDGWQAWCDTCVGHQSVNCTKERDPSSGEVFFEYACARCAAIILHVRRTNPEEREKPAPVASVN